MQSLKTDYNYDCVDVIDTPTREMADKIVRCYSESELNDAFTEMLRDSLEETYQRKRKARMKKRREMIIRQRKIEKLINLVEWWIMFIIIVTLPAVCSLVMWDTLFLKLYWVFIPAALYFIHDYKYI